MNHLSQTTLLSGGDFKPRYLITGSILKQPSLKLKLSKWSVVESVVIEHLDNFNLSEGVKEFALLFSTDLA